MLLLLLGKTSHKFFIEQNLKNGLREKLLGMADIFKRKHKRRGYVSGIYVKSNGADFGPF